MRSDRRPLVARWLMRMLTRAERDFLPPGEEIIAYAFDMGGGDWWWLTREAVYILPTPSRSNDRLGRNRTWRIPLAEVTAFEVHDRGAFWERVVETDSDEPFIGWYDKRKRGAWFNDAVRFELERRSGNA